MKTKSHIACVALFPVLLGIIIGLVVFCSSIQNMTFHRFEFLLDTIISCSATISGFILASVTILVGATSSEIMKEIKKDGALPELRWRYTEALVLGLVVILYFTILGAIIDEKNCVSICHLAISAGLLVAYICSVVSTCYYLLSIIGLVNEDKVTVEQKPSAPDGKYR